MRVILLMFWFGFVLVPLVSAAKPNVLFISIDDLNDYISPLDNHPGIKTPNFDRLAKRSVTFSNAHCAAPACHPSRVAVMTGVHPVRSGIYRNMFGAHGPRWRHESPLLQDAVVLSQHFRNHGYRSVGGGKIFHTLQWTPGDSQNDPSSWDDYRGDPNDPISSDWPRPSLISDAELGLTSGRPLGGGVLSQLFGAAPLLEAEESYGDHLVTDWAINQMNQPTDKPLFLAVGLFRPHIPWEVPKRWFDLYPLKDVKLPKHLEDDLKDAHSHGREGWHKWVRDNKQWKIFMQGYLASISYVDYQLGRLLDGLDSSPLKGNTIIILWSDHGFHIGEKQNWEKLKLKEKGDVTSVLDGVPNALPALVKATRIQDKVRGVGFDWPNKKMVWSKVLEELEEFEAEVERFNIQEMQSEYGDVLFSLVNYARHLNINPEDALERTNKKFKARFQAMEHLM